MNYPHMSFCKQEIKNIFVIALPLIAAFLAQRGMQFIDTVMMSWIGSTALAAGALGVCIFMSTIIFAIGVLSTVGIHIIQAKSAKHYEQISHVLQQGFILALTLSVPCMLIIWYSPSLLLLFGENDKVVAATLELLHSMVWGVPGFLFFIVLRELVSAFALTSIVMIISIATIPITFAANYVLMYGTLYFPPLGIAGIGYGSSIVMWLMFISLLISCRNQRTLKNFVIFKPFIFVNNIYRDLWRIGLPSGILMYLEAGMFLSTTIIMGYFGATALAAHQIALQCVNIAYAIPVSLSAATALRVGHAATQHNINGAKQIVLASIGISFILSMLLAICFICASPMIANLFINKQSADYDSVFQYIVTFLRIAGLFLCVDALQSIANGALRGLRDTFMPMIISSVCYWLIGVGSTYYLAFHTPFSANGVWYGLTLGLFSAAIILTFRFFNRLRYANIKSLKLYQPYT